MSAQDIAIWAFAADWQNIPEAVQRRTETALTDTLGCLLAGTRSDAFIAARQAISLDLSGKVPASSSKALSWAIAASAFDHDDGHYQGGGIHPGSTVLPVLLAGGRGTESRDDLLASLAVGYEIAIRAGFLLAPGIGGGPWRCSGAASTIGAAAALARYRGDGIETIARAIRIASAHGPFASLQLPMVKESIGWAAATAVTAGFLAKTGFGGDAEAFLGIAASPFDLAASAHPFVAGKDWHLLDAYVKPWPCCRAIHAALFAIEAILGEEGWNAETIDRIEVHVPAGSEALSFLPPASADHAQFSFPFAIGCLLARGQVAPESFLPVGRTDPGILAAAAKVTLLPVPDMHPLAQDRSYPAAVTIHGAGGSRHMRINDAPGSVRRSLAADAIQRKYAANAAFAGLTEPEAMRLPSLSPGEIAAALTPFLISPEQEQLS